VRAFLVASVCVLGCSSNHDIVGPFTGDVRRFYVTSIEVPRDGSEALAIADDLDGDGAVDNAFGNVTAVLATTNDLSTNAAEMISAGSIASYVDIQADSLANDPAVGVRLLGAETEEATIAGGRITMGVFESNRTSDTTHPGRAIVHLPIYTNADPLVLPLEGVEIDLEPGALPGDYTAIIRGGIPVQDARTAAYTGMVQMFETEPERHLVFGRRIDTNHDDVISRAEVDDSVISSLVSPDVEHYAGISKPSLSVAFRMQLSPEAPAPQAPTCRDRIKNGDETDVDCGGSCQTCWTGKRCVNSLDCQSQFCRASTCGAPTCTDGVLDGYESDIDCGGSCGPCDTGERCAADRDCASANCDNGVGDLGHCL
jgi:hypothetical protein